MRISLSLTRLFALSLLSVCMAGCYTILVHPTLPPPREYASGHVTFYDNCLRCHESTDVDYFYSELNRGMAVDLPITHTVHMEPYTYYNYPWWFDNEWIRYRYWSDVEEHDKSKDDEKHGGRYRSGSPGDLRSGSTRSVSPATGSGGTVTRSPDRSSTKNDSSGSAERSSRNTDVSNRSRDTQPTETGNSNRGRENDKPADSKSSKSRTGSTRGK